MFGNQTIIQGNGKITINGKTYKGPVRIENGKIYSSDGDTTTSDAVINIIVHGDVDSIETTTGDITVHGNVGSAQATNGNITVEGEIGNASSINGNISAKAIGNATSVNGNAKKWW